MKTILASILVTDIGITLACVGVIIFGIMAYAWREATIKRKEIEDDIYDDSI